MSFKKRLKADFKREDQNLEFLFRQRPGLGGMPALPPPVSQVPCKYLCFLVTRINERVTIDPEHVTNEAERLYGRKRGKWRSRCWSMTQTEAS